MKSLLGVLFFIVTAEAVTFGQDVPKKAPAGLPRSVRRHYITLLSTLKEPEFSKAWKKHATEVFLETERLLRKIQSRGFGYKTVQQIAVTNGAPYWSNGEVGVPQSNSADINDLGYLAHEMGHGFHEKLREEKGFKDVHGEDWAETIRYFVEKRMGTKRESKSVVLDACERDEDKFIQMLKSGELREKWGLK
jgi:hypothetical protein